MTITCKINILINQEEFYKNMILDKNNVIYIKHNKK
jgi:hypothetical protein